MSTYIDHREIHSGRIIHSWACHTARNIAWHYPERAAAIAAGTDPKTQADLARWNALGRRSAA